MARQVGRGEIWMLRFATPDKRRPVLVLSRPSLLECLNTATVVAITSTSHDSPTEVSLGVDDGLKRASCANLANIFTVRQADLRAYVGSVRADTMRQVCQALAIATACDA